MLLRKTSLAKSVWLGFSALIVAIIFIAGINQYGQRKINTTLTLAERSYRIINAKQGLLSDAANVQSTARGFFVSGSEYGLQRYRKRQGDFRNDFEKAKKLTITDSLLEKRFRDVESYFEELVKVEDGLVLLRKNRDFEGLRQSFFKEEDRKPMDRIRKTLAEVEETEQQLLHQRSVKLEETKLFVHWSTLIGCIFAIAVAMIIAFLIKKRLTSRLDKAISVADAIASGNTTIQVLDDYKDEISVLLSSMKRMQQQINSIIQTQTLMIKRHEAGELSYRMDAFNFPGEYGRMISGTNQLITSHIDTQRHLLDIMQSYAIGDLSRDMEELPGEKAILTSTMKTVKLNLVKINTEIKRLTSSAANGDFSARGDADAFKHDFSEMISELNRLMAISDTSLNDISALLKTIADGNLNKRMEGEFQGVFAQMRNDANTTAERLTMIVSRIARSAQTISSAASEIAKGNQDLSRRSEQQAATLEETAASMEELTSTVRQNAEHAHRANQLSLGAASVASEGGEIVGKVVTTMARINDASRKIADIISVIDGIAFQTNILALNAAVEAARAGEQGRGFAVVASEVRSLAQRASGAAKEIKDLIDDSVARVAEGSQLVDQAGKTMSDIVISVQRVTDIMSEISTASQEQSVGIEQINQTITQMDEATQQNAALVEEATAATQSMEEQANELTVAVALFRVDRQLAAAATETTRQRDVPRQLKTMLKATGNASPRSASFSYANQKASDWAEF